MKSNQLRYPRTHGSALFTTIFLIPILLIGSALAYLGFCEARKAYWDHQVKLMCEKDGGIKVYERVPIPREYIDKDGFIRIRSKPKNLAQPLDFEAKLTDAFYYEWVEEPIKQGSLAVGKSTFKAVRASDKKILGSMVVYSRSGGDFPTYAHPSSISCPDVRTRPDPLNLIFIK